MGKVAGFVGFTKIQKSIPLWQLITGCTLATGYSLQSSLRLWLMMVNICLWQLKLASLNVKADPHCCLDTFMIFSSVNARGFLPF